MVEVHGDITLTYAAEVYADGCQLIRDHANLTFSFSHVRSIDASALSVLLGWLRVARAQHHTLSFRGIPKDIHDIASVCNVSHFLA